MSKYLAIIANLWGPQIYKITNIIFPERSIFEQKVTLIHLFNETHRITKKDTYGDSTFVNVDISNKAFKAVILTYTYEDELTEEYLTDLIIRYKEDPSWFHKRLTLTI